MIAEAHCPTAGRHIVPASATVYDWSMIDIAFVFVAGTLGATVIVLAVHPKIERLWRRASLGR